MLEEGIHDMKRSMTVPYAAIQLFYIMIYSGYGMFISAFLLPLGYSSTDIGLILSSANLVSLVLQPMLAALASRKKGRPLYPIIMGLALIELVALLPLLLVSKKSVSLTLLYVLLVTVHSVLSPLITALTDRAKNGGLSLNFGVCRGMGSAGFAGMNVVMGFLIPRVGVISIPAASAVCAAGLMGMLIMSAKRWPREDAVSAGSESAGEESWMSFLSNNIRFVALNAGCIMMMFAQYVMQAYLLQIIQPLGGGSAEMGQILSISGILELPAMFAFDALCRKIKNNTLLKISMLGMLCKMMLTFTAPNVGMVYVSHAFQLIGFALYYPAMIRYIGENMTARSAIRAQTLFALCTTMSGMAANFVGGIMIDHAGVPALGWTCMVLFAIGSATILAVLKGKKTAQA